MKKTTPFLNPTPRETPAPEWTALLVPLSPETGKIDPSIVSIGEHRSTLARRNIKTWLERVGLPYHSPHKFRPGHVQYGQANANSIADYKALSQNVMHSSMEITDETDSNLNDGEIQNRISGLSKKSRLSEHDDLDVELFIQFLKWKKKPALKK